MALFLQSARRKFLPSYSSSRRITSIAQLLSHSHLYRHPKKALQTRNYISEMRKSAFEGNILRILRTEIQYQSEYAPPKQVLEFQTHPSFLFTRILRNPRLQFRLMAFGAAKIFPTQKCFSIDCVRTAKKMVFWFLGPSLISTEIVESASAIENGKGYSLKLLTWNNGKSFYFFFFVLFFLRKTHRMNVPLLVIGHAQNHSLINPSYPVEGRIASCSI